MVGWAIFLDNNIGQAKLLVEQLQSDVDELLTFLGEVGWFDKLKRPANTT